MDLFYGNFTEYFLDLQDNVVLHTETVAGKRVLKNAQGVIIQE
jgi:hypothetical protein